jgi:hypothetical protein
MPVRRLAWLVGAVAAMLATAAMGAAVDACSVATTVTLTSSENPAAYGDQLILTATVIPSTGTTIPGGTVTFVDEEANLGTAAVGSTGQASLVDSTIGAGTHEIEAEYSGSGTFASSVSAALQEVVSVQGSTTLLLPTVNPATYGQTLLFVVSVAPDAGSGTPTGTVTLTDGSAAIGSATLSGGTAAVVVTSLGVGAQVITADYAGDGNFSPSASAAVSEQVDPASTATVLTVSPTTVAVGKTVTLTAAVTSAGGEPGGSVTFSDGGTGLGTATLSGGTATLATCFAKSGTQTLTAAYLGSDDFSASTSAAATLAVATGSKCSTGCGKLLALEREASGITLAAQPAAEPSLATRATLLSASSTPASPQLVTVGAAPATVDEGQSVSLTSVVFGLSGAPFPSGTVDFAQGTTLLGAAATAQVGTTVDALASLRVTLAAGSYPSITATYHPDSSAQPYYAAATSASTAAVTVERVAASTTLDVATSVNPTAKGRPVIVTATVNHPSSSLTPTGTVSFTVNGAGAETVALDSLGQASLTLSSLPAGTQTIAASYAGDPNFSGSSGSTTETVSGATAPTATPSAAPTAVPTATPKPGTTAKPSATPAPSSSSTARAAAAAPVIVPPATTTPPSRPSGLSGSAPLNPDQFDTSEVPPIDAISLVSGIHMGSAPQIILFLVILNLLVLGAIAATSRRGHRLTVQTLEHAGTAPADARPERP